MHSPVWHAYNVTYDTAEVWTEWEYYTDEFFDELGQSNRERKRRKMQHLEDAPPAVVLQDGDINSLMLRMPVNIGRRGSTDVPGIPLFDEIRQEKVALLKDWRERFKSILPEERAPAPKRLDVAAYRQPNGSKKQKLEEPSNVADSMRVKALSTNMQLNPTVSADSSRALGSSKLRNKVTRGHKPISPLASHMEDLSAEDSESQQRKRLRHEGEGQFTPSDYTNSGPTTAPKPKTQASTSKTVGKIIGQKRKIVSDEEPPNDRVVEIHDSKRKDALSGVRKSKRMKR